MGTARDIALVFLCLEAFVAALVPLAILGGLIYGLAWLTRQARQGLQIAQDYARLAHVYVERASQAVAEPFIRANELALMFMTITQRLFQSFGRR